MKQANKSVVVWLNHNIMYMERSAVIFGTLNVFYRGRRFVARLSEW